MNTMSISNSGNNNDALKTAAAVSKSSVHSYSRVSTRSNSMEDDEYEIPTLRSIDDIMMSHNNNVPASLSSVTNGKPTFCIKFLFFLSISAIIFLGSIAYMLSHEKTSIYIKVNIKSNPRIKSKKDLVGGLLGAMGMYAVLFVSVAYIWYKKVQHKHHVLDKDYD